MSCRFCEYPDERALAMNYIEDDYGIISKISYDLSEDGFSLYTYESTLKGVELHRTKGFKFCPFCGEALRKPNLKTVEDNKRWNEDFKKQQKEVQKERKKKEREHEKWLEKEYKKNPYDPTKPRIKNKYFRAAVKNLAKYMNIEEFYWDDEFRRLVGWDGGYIDFDKKAIGPCYETNGVMETFHDSGKTYSVEELCDGYKIND